MSQRIDQTLLGFRMRPAVLQTGRACAFVLAALVLVGFLTAPAHGQGQLSVLTQNYDNGRSGSNNQETTLTPALLQASPTTFGKLFTLSLDNGVHAMPLIMAGVNISGKPTNILIVKTGTSGGSAGPASLWAFNADTGAKLWQHSFGSNVGNTTSSPVIDPTVGTNGAIYVLTYLNSVSQLHAVDPVTGTEMAGSPVRIAASAGGVTFNNSSQQNSRPALLLQGGVIYSGYAHALDTGTYHGWVIGYKYTAGSGFTQVSAWVDTPSGNAGGLWGGLLGDSSSVYTVTGNGSFSANTGGNNYSMSIVRLTPPNLSVADWFAPADEAARSGADADLCGGGMTMIPGTTAIFQGPSKYGSMFLVNAANLGHFGGFIQSFGGQGTAVGYNPISWNSGSAIYAYVWSSGHAINQFSYDMATGRFNPAGVFKSSSFTGGGSLTISSNNGADGILWASGGKELHAMNPADVSAPDYWNSNMNAADNIGGTAGGRYQFTTVANGKVYVTTTTAASAIVVFGTKGAAPPPPAAPTNLGATTVSSSQINLSWTASTTTTSGLTYSLFRSTTAGFTPSSSNQIASGVSGTTFSDNGLAASTTYFYLAEAVDSGGSSSPSNQASAMTLPPASCTTVPSVPAGLTATPASSNQINLSWTASTAGTGCTVSYAVTRDGSQVATGLSGTTFSDTGIACGQFHTYTVTASDAAGSSAASSPVSANTNCGNPSSVQINAGGPAVNPFAADVDFSGGATINHANTINLSGVSNPAPMAVYQTARVTATAGAGTSFTYTIPGFPAGSTQQVRLHFAETFHTTAGSRVFNVSINGTQVLANFDIFAAAGAANKAVIKEFDAAADASGQYVIKFTTVTDKALVSGIEIIAAGGGCSSAPTTPTGLTATTISSSEIDLAWNASTAPSGCTITYSITHNNADLATALSGTSFKDTGLACNTTETFAVFAADQTGSSAGSSPATATTSACSGLQINSGGPAVAPFVADTDFSGGATINHANTINTSNVTNPAPAAVYQTARVAATAGAGTAFSYTIGGFTPGSSHTVRLHFCETFHTTAGSRQFNVSINGTQVLTNFDVFATAGGQNIANIQQFTETANSSGQYVITFTTVIDKALISGIEIE